MALRAGIDIGTNTILLLIAEVENGAVTKVLEDHVRVVRLGQGVDKARAFHPDAMDRAMVCFREYAAQIRRYPGIEVRAVATSGSRDASNSGSFFGRVERETGIKVHVISGEEEARLSLLGTLPNDKRALREMAVLDIGGGSTEIVAVKDEGLVRYSFDMGCVRLTERFLPSDPPAASELARVRDFVRAELAKQPAVLAGVLGRELVGVAGTATYLASSKLELTKFEPLRVDGTKVTASEVRDLTALFAKMTAEQRRGVGGMDKGRADVIVAGAIILGEILETLGLQSYTASVRGLRYGAVLANSI
jgi:exopolyphosphatase/guanosine-5'-triphosphate,3'-diphosphate pyrophosphatase